MVNKTNEIMDCFVNPTKVKIISGVELLGRATAKQLIELCGDIPQATLYRTLNRLCALEIIEVTEEHRKRGTVEKVYALNQKDDFMDSGKIVRENDSTGYLGLFLSFVKSLMNAFSQYTNRANIDIQKDGSGFTATPICVTRDEMEELAYKIAAVIEPYRKNTPSEQRKNHTLALIFTPPTE